VEPKSQVAVLSDVHIGNGAPTCWYQPTVHDAYLTAAIEWIVGQREAVREVILLGDIFDVWTYLPSTRPPTMREIVAANGPLLGPTGPFAKLVRAFPGSVRLLLGNHDGTLTPGDIAELNRSLGGSAAAGEAITLEHCPVVVLRAGGADGTAVAFSHGHHWCMFNAPDETSPWSTLPVGHLVSRAIAYRVTQILTERRLAHAAELPRMGNPGDLKDFSKQVFDLFITGAQAFRDHIAEKLLAAIAKWSGMPDTEPILLPGGMGTTTLRDGASLFAGLHRRWSERREGRVHDADRAAVADLHGADLAWFAQRVALGTTSDLVVMGHTHEAARGLKLSPVQYLNSGCVCVAEPDMKTTPITFSVVDISAATGRLMKVASVRGTPTVMPIAPAEAPPLAVIQRGSDYSCYVRIRNHSGSALTLTGPPRQQGWWAVRPPQVIPDGARADLWIQDEVGLSGSNAALGFRDGAAVGPVELSVGCSTRGSNTVTTTVPDYQTRAGDKPWRTGRVEGGHPLQVRCTVGPPGPPGVTGGPTTESPTAAVQQELACHASPVPGLKPTPEQERAAGFAEYLDLARQIMTLCKIPAYRGKVLSHAWLIARPGTTLLDTTTQPLPGRAGRVRLANPLSHLNPEVFQVNHRTYGPFEYVLILSNGATGGTPAFGGFLFLPASGSPNLHLVSFNVVAMDARGCGHDHHAEMQILEWLRHQTDMSWLRRLTNITVRNSSRARIKPAGEPERFLAYSACNPCSEELASRLSLLNAGRAADDLVQGRIAWLDLYTGHEADCGHATKRDGVQKLRAAGFKVQGPLPSGMKADEPGPDDPGWPPPDRPTR
jgi:Calcineurin-like phosphoesterase